MASSQLNVQSTPNPLQGFPAHISSLLARLHAESKTQESALSNEDFKDRSFDDVMRDKFIALDEDKAQFVFQLCRAINAKTIVEAGTSYGVSTIYLALAVAANVAATGGQGRVIATEYESTKASKAREHWQECGPTVTGVIDLREGDLRETLKQDLDVVDVLLLDSKVPLQFIFLHPVDISIYILVDLQAHTSTNCSLGANGPSNADVGAAKDAVWSGGDYRQHHRFRRKV
jgi:predicted O-methyltransferase YrrM